MNRIITIGREFGSGGREFGRRLSEKLGFAYYDQEIISEISKRTSLSEQYVKAIVERRPSFSFPIHIGQSFYALGNPAFEQTMTVYQEQARIITEMAAKSDCVIVGRCADYVLQEKKNCHRVFIYAPFDYRVQTVIRRLDRNETSAKRLVKKMDKERRYYYEYFTDRKWMDMNHYDLCIDSSKFSETAILDILEALYMK